MNLALHRPPLEHVRPLTIGAAYCRKFEVLAPPHRTGAILLAQLFKSLDMEACGWQESQTDLVDLGFRYGSRRWRVRRL